MKHPMHAEVNTVVYRVDVAHHEDGEVDVTVFDVGSDAESRRAIAYALRKAADKVEHENPVALNRFN